MDIIPYLYSKKNKKFDIYIYIYIYM
jgi:hypothetical protein